VGGCTPFAKASDDLYAEAGAGRIPNTHNVTLEWVKHFGLELEPFFPKELAEVALLKGRRVKMPVGKPVDMSQVPLDLTPDERKIGVSNFDEHYYGDTMRRIGDAIRGLAAGDHAVSRHQHGRIPAAARSVEGCNPLHAVWF
jgi:monoamine oxidase